MNTAPRPPFSRPEKIARGNLRSHYTPKQSGKQTNLSVVDARRELRYNRIRSWRLEVGKQPALANTLPISNLQSPQ